MIRKNCWEVLQCGRQPGGNKIEELGECPAVHAFRAHGVNRGINGGRACWAIAGTFCGGEVQGSFIEKMRGCSECDFFHAVQKEEGKELVSIREIVALIHPDRKQ